jgi:hypothetical protein
MAGEHQRSPTGGVPFWAHQLAEMLLGGVLMVEGARTGRHTAVLVGLGGALVVLGLASDGALGAWPLVGRRLHRIVDVVAAAVLAASPLVLSIDDVLAVVLLEAAALGMLWLALRTEWAARPRRAPRARRPPPPEAASPGPTLARRLGAATGKARAEGPRRLGQAVGRARRATPSGPGRASRPPSDPPVGPPGKPPAAGPS